MISVREARALPKSASQEWRNKFICIEGQCFSQAIKCSTVCMTTQISFVTQSLSKGTTSRGQSMRRSSLTSSKLSLLRYMPTLEVLITVFFFSPPSSSKSVWVSHDLFSVLLLLISLTQSCRILQKWRDLNSIIPLKDIINKESSRR